uniref:Ig-like domain-containing protein n=1 Tax=Neolamprologus brichardi TaxID=32507 RepID=A0A3Q4IGN5_NEOBR
VTVSLSPDLLIRKQKKLSKWEVTFTSTEICAIKGSTVEMHCTYTYPPRINSINTTVQNIFWFIYLPNVEPVDLRIDSKYAGRVWYHCGTNDCTLRITDLRESDSAVYRLKLITNQPGGTYTGSPGVRLSVTESLYSNYFYSGDSISCLICRSSCFPSGHSSFVWYKNEDEIFGESSSLYTKYADGPDSYSCAYEGHRSNPVYINYLYFNVPSVTRTAPGDIIKGSLVSLTCSSEANPLPKYSWYRKAQTLVSKEKQLFFQSIQPSDSGEYYCTAENVLGRRISEYIFINVKYGPNMSIVLMTPSGMIVEGDSVNLTCSSDANPAAKHTWYKENQTLLASPVSIYHFTAISSEDSGNYSCKSENQYGQITSNSRFIDVKCK